MSAAANETQKSGDKLLDRSPAAARQQSEELRIHSDWMRSGMGAATVESCSMSCIPRLMQNKIKGD
jgi:hypothetical protein